MRLDEGSSTQVESGSSEPVARKARKPRKDKGMKKAKAKQRKPANGAPMAALVAARKQYTIDKKHKTASGAASIHCGDSTAKKLIGMALSQVYELAAKAKDLSADTLRKRYSHMNPGAQRMVLGNILRAAK